MEVKVPFITKENYVLTTKDDEEYYVKDNIGFECKFYRNNSDKNRVDKTNFIEFVGSDTIVLKQETSIVSPTIIIERTSFPNFNYVYINEFNRYYFITSITSVRNNLWEIDLTIDVLMSYKDGIKSLKAFVDRNASVTNPMLIDKKRIIEQGVNVEIAEIENDVFFKDNETFQPETDLMFVINGYKIESADALE